MCGIFGVVNTVNTEAQYLRDYVMQACITGAVRGMDSTGIFAIGKKDNKKTSIFYDKAAMNGSQFLEVNEGNGGILLRQSGRNFITIGHHRAATRGEITDENAHPFLHWREDGTAVVGVHNGTLNRWNAKEDGRTFHVDSNWLYYKLANTDDVEKQLSEFDGALALVWHDTRHPSKVFMYTNGGRPLSIGFVEPAYTKGQVNKMLIASEADMMWWLAKRNKIDLLEKKVLNLKPRHLYTFNGDHSEALLGYSVTEIKEAVRSSNVSTFQGGSDWRRCADGVWRTVKDDDANEFESDIAFAVRNAIARAKQEADSPGSEGKEKAQPAAVTSLTPALTPEQRDKLDKEVWADLDDEDLRHVSAISDVSTRPPAATPEEQQVLEKLGVKPGTEVSFDPVFFEPLGDEPDSEDPNAAGTIYGDVIFETVGVDSIARESFIGRIRYVTRRRFNDIENKTVLCRAVGAIRGTKKSGGDTIICAPHHDVLTVWPATASASTTH